MSSINPNAPVIGDIKITNIDNNKSRATVTANRPGGGKITVTIHYSKKVSENEVKTDLEKQMSKLVNLFNSNQNVKLHVHLDEKGTITRGRTQYLGHLDSKIKDLENKRFTEKILR